MLLLTVLSRARESTLPAASSVHSEPARSTLVRLQVLKTRSDIPGLPFNEMNLIFEVQEPKALQCGLSRPQVPSPSLWPPDRSACMWATALATFSLSLGHSLDMTCSKPDEVAQATKRLLGESQPKISWPHRHLLSMTPEPCLPKHRNVPDTFCTAIQGCSRYAPVRSVIAAACCSPRILSPALFACRSVADVDLQD